MIENVGLFHSELVACGLQISGCDSSGNTHLISRPTPPEGVENWEDPTDSIIEAVKNAHSKSLSSDECLALQTLLTEELWTAYQNCRKQPIRAQRAERYKNECDPLYLKITEDAIKANTTPDYSEWLTLKDTIRSELPYPE